MDTKDTTKTEYKNVLVGNYEEDVLGNVPIGIGIYEVIEGVTYQRYMNNWFYKMVKDDRNSRRERNGGDFLSVIHPEDRKNIAGAIEKVKEGEDLVVATCRAVAGDGGLVWVRIIASVAVRRKDYILVYCAYSSMEYEIEARNDLEKNNTLLNQALQGAEMVVWEYDPVKKELAQTDRCTGLTGYTNKVIHNAPESMINAGYVHQDSVEEYRKFFSKFCNSKVRVEADFRVKNWETSEYWWEHTTLTPLFNEEGELIKGVGTSINVSERKENELRYEQKIDEMEKMNSSNLIEKARHNITLNTTLYYEINMNGRYETKNFPSYEQSLLDLIKTGNKDSDKKIIWNNFNIETLLEKYKKGIVSGSHIFKRIVSEDRTIWCEVRYILSEEPTYHDLIAFIYSYDVTERILKEQIIKRISEIEYEILGVIDVKSEMYSIRTDSSDISDMGMEREGSYEDNCIENIIINVNESEKDDVVQKLKIENVLNQLDKEEIYSFTYFALEYGDKRRKQLKFSYLDEEKEQILFSRTDITDTYKQEQEQLIITEQALLDAKKANQAKTDFFSNMSHDMRTPMNGILGLAALMKDKEDVEDMKRDAEQILLSGRYLLNLINDTLDMNKIESGMLELHPEPIRCEDVFRNVLSTANLMAADKNISIKVHSPDINYDEWKTVMADASRLEQIFMNVVSNAIKYTKAGGEVQIEMESVEITDKYVCDKYIVRDNGIGMSKEFLPHIFEMFKQEGRINTERQNGTGLGMPIVKKLVELMNGTISIKSEINQGTEVTVILKYPRCENIEEKNSKVSKVDISVLEGKKVLLCEDHPLNRQIAEKILVKKNVTVVSAENGVQGLKLFEKSDIEEYAVILMDIRMPLMDGIETTKSIRNLNRSDAKSIPIIAMTANSFDEDVKKCLDAGMNAHLSKPFEIDKLYEIIAQNIIAKHK